MLFNSYEFILLFLPITLGVYFLLNKKKMTLAARAWLVFASLFFYSWWNAIYLPLILSSMMFNYAMGTVIGKISQDNDKSKKTFLITGIAANLGLLAYYKYTDFFISNINSLTGAGFNLLHIVLPLGISFFTFTQIAYLVDAYRGEAKEYDLLNYSLFVTFFPHLLAGPILHHKDMMPQFESVKNKIFQKRNFALGIFLFSMGLFKKVGIADTFSGWADAGFESKAALNALEAWCASLSYTFQLYFDFSGYTDMALGASWMFNIKLPINFNSPYKALNIQDFWRRWHMSLSRFLRDYIYIPLGGSKKSGKRTYLNLLATFIIGGLWHGAGWTFVLWGFLHGLGLVIHRAWTKLNINLPKALAWFITFNFVNLCWVFFRAKTIEDALRMLKSMFGFSAASVPNITNMSSSLASIGGNLETPIFIFIFLLFCLFFKNSNEMAQKYKPDYKSLLLTVFFIVAGFISLNKVSEFLYFNF